MINVTPLIDALHGEGIGVSEKARKYIGASGIGNECDAYLAFSMRGFPDTPSHPRLKRIFRMGHLLEDEIIQNLRDAGMFVIDKDPSSGGTKQFFFSANEGHVRAHADGKIIINNIEHILEIKTMNDAMFKRFKKHGLKKSHPKYIDQVQLMMGLSGVGQALLVGLSKNTSEIHMQVLEYDEMRYEYLMGRIDIIMSGTVEKIASKPDDWRCKMCFKSDVCWHGVAPEEPECSHCTYAVPHTDHGWYCTSKEEVARGLCENYVMYRPDEKDDGK